MLSRRSSLIAIAAAAVGAGFLLGLAGWLQPHRPLEFCALILAGILISAFAVQPASSEDRAMMPPSFVIEFASLLIFGAHATLLVAIAGALARGFADSQHAHQVPADADERCHGRGRDRGGGLRASVAGRHARTLRMAVRCGVDCRGSRCVLHRESAVDPGRAAAPRETASTSIVARADRFSMGRSISSAPPSRWRSSN